MSEERQGDFVESLLDEAFADTVANGKHYEAHTLKPMATRDGPGNSRMRLVLDLGVGDSVARLDSTKGKRIYGPNSVEITWWPDGSIDTVIYDLGKAPEMSKEGFDGRYVPTATKDGRKLGRKPGETYDKTEFEWDGVSQTLGDWYKDTRRDPSVDLTLLRVRVKQLGWSVERALTTPKATRTRK